MDCDLMEMRREDDPNFWECAVAQFGNKSPTFAQHDQSKWTNNQSHRRTERFRSQRVQFPSTTSQPDFHCIYLRHDWNPLSVFSREGTRSSTTNGLNWTNHVAAFVRTVRTRQPTRSQRLSRHPRLQL